MKRRQWLALCAAIFYLLTLIFSVSFVATQTQHEHLNGETCAICTTLRDCNERLHAPDEAPRTGDGLRRRQGTVVICLTPVRRREVCRFGTPVSLRDKLTN